MPEMRKNNAKKMKIEYLSVDQLIPYGNNAKIHTAEQIDQIKKSIQEFGFNDPIAIDASNEIIEGHGRLIAAKELKILSVPVIRLNELNDDEKRAYMLVHNQLTMNSGFDYDLLLEELNGIEIDMTQYGFDVDEEDQSIQIENKEYTLDSFGDEKFEYECSECGFKFNA